MMNIRTVNGYPLISYYSCSKITNVYPWKQWGARKTQHKKRRKTTSEMKDYPNLCSVWILFIFFLSVLSIENKTEETEKTGR